IVFIKGRLQLEESSQPKIVVNEIAPLDGVQPPLPYGVVVRVRLCGNGEIARRLYDLFQEKPGETPVRLELIRERDFQAVLEPESGVRADSEFVARVREICGGDSVRLH